MYQTAYETNLDVEKPNTVFVTTKQNVVKVVVQSEVRGRVYMSSLVTKELTTQKLQM